MNMMTTVALPPLPSPNPEAMRRALLGETMLADFDRQRRLRCLFAAFDRDDMETGVDLLLEALDALDGDPDAEQGAWRETHGSGVTPAAYQAGEDAEDDDLDEANGDELDGHLGEDDFHTAGFCGDGQPGCPLSDPGEPDHEAEADHDDEPVTWRERGEEAQPANMMGGVLSAQHDDDERDEPTARRRHRDRIRHTRCNRVGAPPYPRYRVRNVVQPVPGFGAALS